MGKEERRIEFQAWDTLNKVMYTNPFNGIIGGMNDIFANTGDWIYMQYTGQKDKEGTKVFEKDIVEVTFLIGDVSCSAAVRFIDQYIVTFEWGKFSFGGYTFDDSHIESIKVIGNIYENPALLFEKGEM